MKKLQNIRQVFLDMDGTIYHGSRLYPSTLPFLDFLRRRGVGYAFLSNNSSRSLDEYVEKLGRMGITVGRDGFYTSTEYCIDYLKKHHPEIRRIHVLGMKSIFPAFEAAGFQIDDDDPQGVIVAFDRSLTYDKLCLTAWFLKRGVPGFATHPDLFCPGNEPRCLLVDCGAVTKALEAAADVRLKVLGKPDPGMLAAAAARCGVPVTACLMIGDRLATDIAVGVNAGAMTCRINGPGADTTPAAGIVPDLEMRDLGELQKLWTAECSRSVPSGADIG